MLFFVYCICIKYFDAQNVFNIRNLFTFCIFTCCHTGTGLIHSTKVIPDMVPGFVLYLTLADDIKD